MRRLLSIFPLTALGGAIGFMIFVSIRDFSTFNGNEMFIRCLIFVPTIYIFIRNLLYLLKGSNKGDTRK